MLFIIRKRAPDNFRSSLIRTNNVDHVMQHTQKRGYPHSDTILTKFGLQVASL
jgi:hypothetical protein